jgi:hypothetical protein
VGYRPIALDPDVREQFMDITPIVVGSAIGIVLIVLGFVALVTQKIYIDPRTNAPTEIEVPILGKMKANYPALVFVFLGSVIAFYGMNRYTEAPKVRWHIAGTVVTKLAHINWQETQIELSPTLTHYIDPQSGQFTIDLDIEGNRTFEEAVQTIHVSHPRVEGIHIDPAHEYNSFKAGANSKLVLAPATTRVYKFELEPTPDQ